MRLIMNPYTTTPYVFEPYEPCPCESGKKYKFCCYDKSKNMSSSNQVYNAKRLYSESHKHFRDTDFKTCFGFNNNCNHGYISAHSLQNNGVLNLNSIYEIYAEIPAKFGKDLYFKDIDYWTLYPNSNTGRYNVQFQMDWFIKKLAYLDNAWKL